jgi:hypothetical protein
MDNPWVCQDLDEAASHRSLVPGLDTGDLVERAEHHGTYTISVQGHSGRGLFYKSHTGFNDTTTISSQDSLTTSRLLGVVIKHQARPLRFTIVEVGNRI